MAPLLEHEEDTSSFTPVKPTKQQWTITMFIIIFGHQAYRLPSHLQNQQDDNEQMCYLWAPTLEHEEDDELGLSFSFIVAKNNMMMVSIVTTCNYLSSSFGTYSKTWNNTTTTSNCTMFWCMFQNMKRTENLAHHPPSHLQERTWWWQATALFIVIFWCLLQIMKTTINNTIVRCHLWAHALEHEEDDELVYHPPSHL